MNIPDSAAKALGSVVPPRYWDNHERFYDDSGNFIADDKVSDTNEIKDLERQLRNPSPSFPPGMTSVPPVSGLEELPNDPPTAEAYWKAWDWAHAYAPAFIYNNSNPYLQAPPFGPYEGAEKDWLPQTPSLGSRVEKSVSKALNSLPESVQEYAWPAVGFARAFASLPRYAAQDLTGVGETIGNKLSEDGGFVERVFNLTHPQR